MPRRWCHRWGWFRTSIPVRSSLEIEDTVFIPVKLVEGIEIKDGIEVHDYEVETLALIHVEGLTIEEAASRMGLSKTTFWRILEQCRFKLAKALLERKPVKIVSTRTRGQGNESLLTEKPVSSSGEKNGLVV